MTRSRAHVSRRRTAVKGSTLEVCLTYTHTQTCNGSRVTARYSGSMQRRHLTLRREKERRETAALVSAMASKRVGPFRNKE